MARKPRRDRGQKRINPRDTEVITWIGEQYAVRLDVLQRLLGERAEQPTREKDLVQDRTAQRVLNRWDALNLIAQQKLLAGEPKWIWLTTQGLREAGLDYRVWRPTVAQLRHLHTVNLVRMAIEKTYEANLQTWRSERLLRKEHYGKSEFHVPDGEIVTNERIRIGVEIELTLKSRNRAKQIVRRLAHQYRKGQVWFFVTPQTHNLIAEVTTDWRDVFEIFSLQKVMG